MAEFDEAILSSLASEIESLILKIIFDNCLGCIHNNLSQNEHTCLDVSYESIVNEQLKDVLLTVKSNIMKLHILETLSCDDKFILLLKQKLLR